jgi:ADP-heptose:LPS heptosyltransferase
MLPYIREKYADAQVTVVCQQHIAEFYEACPYVDAIVSFDRKRIFTEKGYQDELLSRLKAIEADLLLNSVYSREPLTDVLALSCEARRTVALEGDLSNMKAETRDKHNRLYSKLIACPGVHKGELERHRDFLAGLGVEPRELKPLAWITPEDASWAKAFLANNGFAPEKTVVMFAGAQQAMKFYDGYGDALAPVCRERGFAVIALGRAEHGPLSQRNLERSGAPGVNLCGRTTVRQSTALINRCRLAVGADTGLAHLACAVGTPNAIVLGGGHFGRSCLTPLSRRSPACPWHATDATGTAATVATIALPI